MIFSTRTAAPLLGMATLVALGLAAKPAAAQTTISFDNYPIGNANFSDIGSPYSTQGFTLSAPTGLSVVSGSSLYGDGENSLSFHASEDIITLAPTTTGQIFSLNSLDIGSFENNFNPGLSADAVLTGTLLGGGTVTDTVTTSGAAKTFNFTDLTGLTSLTLQGIDKASNAGTNPLYNNFVLDAPAAPTPSAAPEPSAVAGLGMTVLGLGGLVLRARKRKAVAG